MVIGTDLYLSSYSYRNVAAAFCEASLKYVCIVSDVSVRAYLRSAISRL